ncbi:hypothetical protein [Butyrivibrio sp. AE3009]|uniref:hypothetical protein n=1 Tax=Butyrivibrio sp. AE3009 TaxID=1280666 RepID=UPI0003B37D12|nr:hypothetical protein [Butyrivibrio sp. AE3009]
MKKKIITIAAVVAAAAVFGGICFFNWKSAKDLPKERAETVELKTDENPAQNSGDDKGKSDKKAGKGSLFKKKETAEVPTFSDKYYVASYYGGSSWGIWYDCFSLKVIVSSDKELLVYVPSDGEHNYIYMTSLPLSDAQYNGITRGIDRNKLYTLDPELEKDVCDGYSDFLILYDENDYELKACGGYMPTNKDFNKMLSNLFNNVPKDELAKLWDMWREELIAREESVRYKTDYQTRDYFCLDCHRQIIDTFEEYVILDENEYTKAKEINKLIKKDMISERPDDIYDNSKDECGTNDGDNATYHYSKVKNVCLIDDHILAITVSAETDIHTAPHPWLSEKQFLYDMNTGERLDLQEYLGKDEEAFKKLVADATYDFYTKNPDAQHGFYGCSEEDIHEKAYEYAGYDTTKLFLYPTHMELIYIDDGMVPHGHGEYVIYIPYGEIGV